MVLVSLAVAALVVLAVLLTLVQCVKTRRGRGGGRAKRSEATGDSGEDSDYSSYDGEEEEETRMGETVMSDTSSVQVSQGAELAEHNHHYSESPTSAAVPEAAPECQLRDPREVNVPTIRPRGREADPAAPGPDSVLIPEAGARTDPRTST